MRPSPHADDRYASNDRVTAALAEVRADAISDELQAQELAWLEEALRQLENE